MPAASLGQVGTRAAAVRTLKSQLPLEERTHMQMTGIPFGVIDWSTVDAVDYPGIGGKATWRTREFSGIRVRMVEYSPGYLADHWCSKGHVVFVIEGEFESELADGRKYRLTAGMSYQVADNAEPHRSFTTTGVKLFIVD
jgi:hypothetical protein